MEKIYTLWKIERRTNSLNQQSKIFLLDNDSIETFYLEPGIPSYFFYLYNYDDKLFLGNA